MYNNFKKGDKLKIKDTKNVRHFNFEAIGNVCVLSDFEAKEINKGYVPCLFGNKFGVNYEIGDLQKLNGGSCNGCDHNCEHVCEDEDIEVMTLEQVCKELGRDILIEK